MLLFGSILLVAQAQVELERFHGIFAGQFAAGAAIVDHPAGPIIVAGSTFFGPSDWPWTDEYWSVLSKVSPNPGDYRVNYASTRRDIVALDAGNVLGGPESELVLVLASGRVEIRDPVSRALLHSFQGIGQPVGVEIGNSDGDVEDEILIVSSSACAAFDGAGVLAWQTTLLFGGDVVVAQMDSDPSMEVAALNGAVMDVATLSVQMTLSEEAIDLDVGDFDGDGVNELVMLRLRIHSYPVMIWDAGTGAIKAQLYDPTWSYHYNPQCVRAADLDRDGIPEVLAGFSRKPPANTTDLVIWDARSNLLLQDFRTDVTIPREILVGNLDEDAPVEVMVLGEGAQILDPRTVPATVEWQSEGLQSFCTGPVLADLEGDGNPEVVVSGIGFGLHEVFLSVHDADDLTFRLLSDRVGGANSTEIALELEARDLDGDGREEILLAGKSSGTNRGYARAFALNRRTGVLERTWRAGNGDNSPPRLACVEAVDLDQDGDFEICAGEEDSEYRRPLVHLFEYPSGRQLFEFGMMGPSRFGSIIDLASGDLDGDGYPELIVLVKDYGIYVFDRASTAPKAHFLHPFTSMDVAKRGRETYVLLSDNSGVLSVHRLIPGGGFAPVGATSGLLSSVNGLQAGPGAHLWARAEAPLFLVHLPGNRIAWQSEDFGWNSNRPGMELLADPLHPERCLMAGPYGLYGYWAR